MSRDIPIDSVGIYGFKLVLLLRPHSPRGILLATTLAKISPPRHNISPGRPYVFLYPIMREVVDIS